jgi:mannose-6-phosphate isomerase-like protein (cupin superfamily)
MFAALATTVLMLFAMGYFLLGTLPLLVRLKYDVPADARFMRGLFNTYFIALGCTAALAAVSYGFIGEPAFGAGAAGIAALALVLRALMLKRMDALRASMQPGDPAAVRKFRRLHIAGLLANGAQLAVVGWGLTRLSTEGDPRSLPIPKRVLTGRDASGKSVFRSRTVTPQVVEIESNPGLAFYELYSTEGVPQLTGQEPDPMLKKTRDFPDPGGTNFRLISYPPRRAPGWKPPEGVTFESALSELNDKVPGMGRHFDRSTPGMHTTDTVDYCIVVRGEMTLELDDGEIVQLRQGDCVIQNGTRHRWRNALAEPCLMAFISIGGKPRDGSA